MRLSDTYPRVAAATLLVDAFVSNFVDSVDRSVWGYSASLCLASWGFARVATSSAALGYSSAPYAYRGALEHCLAW